jgi:small-conductance mechanosensitive channel
LKGLTLKTLKEDKEKLEGQLRQLIQASNNARVQAQRVEGMLMYINDNIQAFEKLEKAKSEGAK